MTNVHDILEKSRATGARLQPNEAAVLFAAAVRLAAAQGATLRSRLLQIDEAGVLHVASFDDQAPESEPGYLAPELAQADAPRKSEPRVQVYAAGALGYELLTGQRAAGRPPGAELAGPLGDIVRIALANDRRERFGDLTQLHDAIEGVQPRAPAEGERSILMGLRGRWSRPPPEKEALAKLIEKLHVLEGQVQQLAKAQGRVEASARETAEHLDRMLEGQQRLQQKPRGSGLASALAAGVLGAIAVFAAAWALGMIRSPMRAEVAPQPPPLAQPPVQPAQPPPAPEPVAAADASVVAQPAPAVDAGAAAPAPVDAGAVAAADAGAVDAGALAVEDDPTIPLPGEKPAPAPAKAQPPAKKKPLQVSQAAMLHAVALSQVRRGESALEKGRADEALESFRAALENEPTIAVAFRGMGMAYALQSNDAQALQAYEKYLKLAPSAADASDIRRSIAELKARSRIGAGEK